MVFFAVTSLRLVERARTRAQSQFKHVLQNERQFNQAHLMMANGFKRS